MKSHGPSPEDVGRVFEALAHAARREIVQMLSTLGDELPSGYLAARFQHSWPTTTRHLGVLEAAGVVSVRREGRGSHYRLRRDHLLQVVEGWLGLLEPPTPRKKWAPRGPRTTHGLKRAADAPPTPQLHRKAGRPDGR